MSSKKIVTRELPKEKISLVRTSEGMRDLLLTHLEKLANGEITASTANAVARLADVTINSVQLELNVAKFVQNSKRGQRPETLTLGKG